MTITKHDGIAILPKRCNKCNRLFWLECYDTYYKEVGIEHYSLKRIKCMECIIKEKVIEHSKLLRYEEANKI